MFKVISLRYVSTKSKSSPYSPHSQILIYCYWWLVAIIDSTITSQPQATNNTAPMTTAAMSTRNSLFTMNQRRNSVVSEQRLISNLSFLFLWPWFGCWLESVWFKVGAWEINGPVEETFDLRMSSSYSPCSISWLTRVGHFGCLFDEKGVGCWRKKKMRRK